MVCLVLENIPIRGPSLSDLFLFCIMAKRQRNRRRANNKRGNNSQRNTLRTVNRAVHFKPVRARVSVDPPSISRTVAGSAIVPVLLLVGDSSTSGKFTVGSIDSYSKLALNQSKNGSQETVLNATSLNASNIHDALVAWMQWKTDIRMNTSWALRKVCLWGPNPLMGSANYQNVEMGLRVDLGDISNGAEIRDAGTTTRRPTAGLSLPYSIWMSKLDSDVITIFPDAASSNCPLASGSIWGRLHLSLDWRRGPSSMFSQVLGKAAAASSASEPLVTSAAPGRR